MSKLEITAQEAQDLLEGTQGIVMLYKHYDALPFEFPETYKWFHTNDEVWLGLECDEDIHFIHKLPANTYNYKKKRVMTKGEKTGIKVILIIAAMFVASILWNLIKSM